MMIGIKIPKITYPNDLVTLPGQVINSKALNIFMIENDKKENPKKINIYIYTRLKKPYNWLVTNQLLNNLPVCITSDFNSQTIDNLTGIQLFYISRLIT